MKKLLDDYFSKEQVQDSLGDIGEPSSGSKDELIRRLLNNWKSHNRDIYDLLDFTDKTSLQMICYYYGLEAYPTSNSTFKRRIKKAKLLGSDSKPKPTAHVNRSHDSLVNEPKIRTDESSETSHVHFHIGSVTHSKWGKIGAVSTIVGIVIMIIIFVMG